VKAHHIRFNENLNTYVDWSFVLEYMKYVNKFVRIFNFPFYFRGEVYDPFETLTLSEQNFDILFKDYVNSFYDAIKRATNPKVREFI
ncbi:CDP-glycerol:glycerophosphate glycerophosphotransferase, partial [Staphylococcus warneri]